MTRWLLLPLGLGYGCVISFIFPTRQTIVGQAVERHDLMRAVALNAAGQNLTRILGPAMAGLLIAAVGIGGAFTVAALLHVIAMATTLRLPSLRVELTGPQTRLARSVADGMSYVRRDPVLFSTFLTAAICTVFIMPYTTLMPVFATEELGLGASGLGLLMAAIGVGAVAGTLLIASVSVVPGVRGSQIIAVGAFAMLVLAFSQSTNVPLAASLLFCAGLVSAGFFATNQTVLQMRAEEAMRGRVVALNILSWGLLPLGQLPLGALADAIGAPGATAIACLVALTLVGAVALRYPEVRGRAIPD
jgi:predicted MFS family arabinose efflux permease